VGRPTALFQVRDVDSLAVAPAKDGGRIFTATLRSRRVSVALYTSPIPPAPMEAVIW